MHLIKIKDTILTHSPHQSQHRHHFSRAQQHLQRNTKKQIIISNLGSLCVCVLGRWWLWGGGLLLLNIFKYHN